jgi:hypothetical protein
MNITPRHWCILFALYYREPSIVSGISAAICSKTKFGPIDHRHLQSSSIRVYVPFSAFLPFLKYILEVMFCEGVHNYLRFCLDLLNYVRMGYSSFISNRGKREKYIGAWQSCYFWSKIPLWKRKYEAVCCCDATVSSFVDKVRGEVFAHFHTVTIKRHSSTLNWLLWIVRADSLLIIPLILENYECVLDFALHMSRLFRSWWVWTWNSNTRVGLMLFFPRYFV